MSGKRYSQEQILGVLKEIDGGVSIASVSRTHGIGVQTLYAWCKRFAGMSSTRADEIKALQVEKSGHERVLVH